ncbi:MAG: hypothetical protein ACO4AI_07320, partial [Prochlorothrix sp.]
MSGSLLFKSEEKAILQDLQESVNEQALSLHRELSIHVEALISLGTLFRHQETTSWEEFQVGVSHFRRFTLITPP